jgi:hypothetical protein
MHSTSDELRNCLFYSNIPTGSPEREDESPVCRVTCVWTGQGRGMTTHSAHRINMRVVKMHKHRLHPDVLQSGTEQQAVVCRLRNSETHSTDDKCASGRKRQ